MLSNVNKHNYVHEHTTLHTCNSNLIRTVKVSYHMNSQAEWQNDSSKRHMSQARRPS